MPKDNVKTYLAEWKSVAGAVGALATLLPLSAHWVEGMLPPENTGADVCAVVLSLVAIISAYFLCRDFNKDKLKRATRLALIAVVVLIAAHSIARLGLIVNLPGGGSVVRGFALQQRVLNDLHSGDTNSTEPVRLLKTYGYRSADAIWTFRWSAIFLVGGTFCLAGVSLTLLCSLFVLRQHLDKVNPNGLAQPAPKGKLRSGEGSA